MPSRKSSLIDSSRSMSLSIEALANIGSFQWDAETDQLEWSEHLYEIYGYEPYSVPLSFDFFLSHLEGENRQQFLNALYANTATGTEYQFEEYITRKDGSKAILLSSIKPVLNTQNKLIKGLGVCRDVTELRKKDQQLINQKAFFRKILDELPVHVTVKDPNFKFKLLNKSFIKSLISPDIELNGDQELDGHNILSAPMEIQDQMELKDQEALKSGTEVKFNAWIPNTDGENRLYTIIKKTLVDENNDGRDLLTVGWDRTDEYKLEQALRDNEERLSVATNGGKLAIIDWELKSGKVKANDIYFDMIGKNRANYVPSFDAFSNTIVYPDDRDLVIETMQCIFKDKPETYEVEYRVNHPEKDFIWLSHKGTLILKDDEPYRIVAVLQDITYRKKYEDEITRSNERLNNIIQTAPGVVFRFTPEIGMPALSLSHQITKLTEYASEDFYPHGEIKFEELINEHDRYMNREIMMKSINQDKSEFQNSFRIKTKSGTEKWIWMKAQITKREIDNLVLEGFLVDITDQVNAEDRVISAALQAEDNQRQRISEEIHDGVQQTLISALMGLQHLSETIKEKAPEIMGQYQMALNTLKSGVEETRGIAHSIMPKSIEDFGLIETIEQVIDQLNTNTITNFTFYENLGEERLSRSIEISLYRIFQEAITNINKHANASEVMVQISKSKHVIQMNIEDNGDGFDYGNIDQLKVGFGLASMKSRAGSLSGIVEISSSPNQGTTIWVEVPVSN